MGWDTLHVMTVSYEVRGEGTPLIVLHGFPLDHRSMLPLDPLVAAPGWARYYLDLPGFGASAAGVEIDSSLAVAEAVAEFIRREFGDMPFALVGHSFGGLVARYLAGVFGSQVLGLALIAPVVVAEHERRRAPAHTVLVPAGSWIAELSDEDREGFESNCIIHTPQMWRVYRDQIIAGISTNDPGVVERVGANYALPGEPERRFGAFAAPSVLILGRYDSSVGYRDQLDLVDDYPSSTVAVLDRAGHMPFLEQPELVETLLRDWLERVRSCAAEGA